MRLFFFLLSLGKLCAIIANGNSCRFCGRRAEGCRERMPVPEQPKKYVLLDRDGTIIVNKHYQKDPEITELLPHAREGLDLLRSSGFGLVLVTNQSGIGRGLLTRADMTAVNRRMARELGGEEDYFAGMYCCPHVPEDGCSCRKPLPGMAEQAARDLGFALREAYVVGDSEGDIKMGDAAGAATVLVRTGYGSGVEEKGNVCPGYVADDLLDAAEWIVRQENAQDRT